MNELIFILIIAIFMLSIYLFNRLFGKNGLYMILTIMIIVSYISSFKITVLLGFNSNCYIFSYITVFMILYLILNKTNKKEKNKVLLLSLIISVITTIFIILMNLSVSTINDTISINMKSIFMDNYKILIMFPILLFINEFITVKLYQFLKKIYDTVFTNILLCTIIIGVMNISFYNLIVYVNVLPLVEITKLSLSTYVICLIEALIYIPFIIYMSKQKQVKL